MPPQVAIGVPLEDVEGVGDAGAVNIMYGGTGRLSPSGTQLWAQGRGGLVDGPERGDYFGGSLSTGTAHGRPRR